MNMDEYVRAYVAHHLNVPIRDVAGFKFFASEAFAYSEYTYEYFSCEILVTLTSGKEKTVYLGENDTVDFLNDFAKAQS